MRILLEQEMLFVEWSRHSYSWCALFKDLLAKAEFEHLDLQVSRAVFYIASAPAVVRALENRRVGGGAGE